MFEHIQVLSYILLILAATWLVIYLHNEFVKAPYHYLKAIRNYNICIVILFALRLVFFYFRTNLLEDFNPDSEQVIVSLIQLSLSVLMIVMVVLMLLILLSFRSIIPRLVIRILLIILILAVGFFYGVSIFFPEADSKLLQGISQILNNSFVFNLVIHNLEFLLVICFLLFWNKNFKDRGRRRISVLFSWTYIICNCVSLAVLFLMMKVQMGQVFTWSLKVMVMALFILAPVIWMRIVFIPYSRSMLKMINRSGEMQALYLRYNITNREAEIIELIMEGKGNHEIKDKLFISYHTVKNHLSNIFRKLGVSSRHQLVHLFISNQNQTEK